MTKSGLMRWITSHRVVLESASGPVPAVADHIAGGEIRGSWWVHPSAKEIFRLTRALRDDPDILVARLVSGKITFVHRSAWPALVRLADRFPRRALARLEERHSASGKHVIVTTPFPRWVPRDVEKKAAAMTEEAAEQALGDWTKRRSS